MINDYTPTHLPDYAVCRACGGIKRGIPDVERYLEARRASNRVRNCKCGEKPARAA